MKELCLQDRSPRPAHIVTATRGTAQLEPTLRYAEELNVAPFNSPFRPHRFGNFNVLEVRVSQENILIVTDAGIVRLPPEQVAYSYLLD